MSLFGGPPEIASRQASYPEEPWRWRLDWESGRIPSGTWRSVRSAWFVAAFVLLISTPLVFVVHKEWPTNKLAIVALVFPLFGLWLTAVATWVTLRWRRFGGTWFAMDPVPASPGGQLRGVIHARFPIDRSSAEATVLLQLTCLRRVAVRSSDDVDVSEPIVWREELEIPVADLSTGPAGAEIPVAFDVPTDAPETSGAGNSAGAFWVLTAKASLSGVDFHEEYDVPVHRTATSLIGTFGVRPSQPRLRVTPVDVHELARHGIQVVRRDERLEVRCGPARNRSFLAGMTVLTLIWMGAWWLQSVIGVPWILQGLTLVFLALFVVICVDLWLSSTTVTVEKGWVSRRYAILGVGVTKAWPTSDVDKVILRIGSQTQGRTGVPYYDVRASLKAVTGIAGRTQTLVPRIRTKRHAEWLAARIREAAGLNGEGAA